MARNEVAPAARISAMTGAKAAARSDAIWTLSAAEPERNFLSSGRDKTRLTCARDQLAVPRAVGMLRWLSAAAMSRNVAAPAARISAMTGAKAAARSDAICLLDAVAAANLVADLAAKNRSRVDFRPRERPRFFVDVNSCCPFIRRLSLATLAVGISQHQLGEMLHVVCAVVAYTLCKHSIVLSKHLILRYNLCLLRRVLFTTAAGNANVKAFGPLAKVKSLGSKS